MKLAARAHPIQEVYQATSNWTMPELRAGETQLEQSDREIASWRLNHAGHWQEQTEPPLSVVYLKTKVGEKSADMKAVRLRLILVSAADVRGAENWLGPLKTCRTRVRSIRGCHVRIRRVCCYGHMRPMAILAPFSGWDPNPLKTPKLQGRPMKAAWFDALVFDPRFGGQNCLSFFLLRAPFGQYGPVAAT